MTNFETGSIVWVRFSQKWWPARVTSLEECPIQYVDSLKKKQPLAIVKFFNELEFHDVSKPEHILPYSCGRKNDIIKKGLNAVKYDPTLTEKFEADVAMAEKLTGGNMEIIKELREISAKRRIIDYSDLGFGTPKVKKLSKDQSLQRKGFSDIGEAIQYKKGCIPITTRIIEHKVKIMEQPIQKVTEDQMKNASSWYKCYSCGFTCGRLNVIIWHNKVHLNKVENYDSGIRIPGRRRRRHKTKRNKLKKLKTGDDIDHSQTNGHASPKESSQEASQLLLDWDDEEEEHENENLGEKELVDNGKDRPVNGLNNEEDDDSDDYEDDSDTMDDDYDDSYPNRGQRQPMPKQVDINSAFDALLADSSPLHRSNQNSSYVNNDSDSEVSDWDKYYSKEGEEEESEESEENDTDSKEALEENTENGHSSKREFVNNNKRKQPSDISSDDSSNSSGRHRKRGKKSKSKSIEPGRGDETKRKSFGVESFSDKTKKSKGTKTKGRSRSPNSHSSSSKHNKDVESPSSPGPSISKRSSPLHERNTREDQTEEHSTHSSSSSTSSGPAYMLVAVDAHGNNVPMPVLSEGGNHLVAVEASMEDGTTRTLYIDPAHLGPNVDLNNLMLHIDNSGQETVIIPTSSSDGEIISSTLVEQPVQDSENSFKEEKEEENSPTPSQEQEVTTEETKEIKNADQDEKEANQQDLKVEEQNEMGTELVEKEELKQDEQEALKQDEKEPVEEEVLKMEIKSENAVSKEIMVQTLVNKEIIIETLTNEEIKNESVVNKDTNKEKMNGHENKMNQQPVLEIEEDLEEEEENAQSEELEEEFDNAQYEEPIEDDDDDDDELPNITLGATSGEMFKPDDIVWVLTHGLWWPSFVLKIYSKESKASILYINCQQKTPIKVTLSRLKSFSFIDYLDIFESQENKAVGLTEAMEMAKNFKELKFKNALDKTPKQFFSLPVSEQRSIIDMKNLELREISVVSNPNPADPPQSPAHITTSPTPITVSDSDSENCTPRVSPVPEISEDCLSERDLIKLASATKARRSANEPYVKFIKSDACLEHLRNVSTGVFQSERHNYFKENYRNPDYLLLVSDVHSTGFEFFGEEDEEGQSSEVMSYLFHNFENERIDIDLDSSQRRMYVNTILYPEAIKQSLRIVGKFREEELELLLENGLYQTRTECKAKRLEFC